jgi:hypothetical protein
MSDDRFASNGSPDFSPAERGRKVDETLSSRFDILNQHLKEVEKCLKKLKPPHQVWVSYGPEVDERGNYIGRSNVPDMLGLAEHEGKWRLCHAYDASGDGDLRDLLPLADCSIDIRIDAVPHLRELHQRIVEAKEAYVPDVDKAIQELKRLCTDLHP